MPTSPNQPSPRIYYGWIIVGAMFAVNVAVHASANFTFGLFLKPMSEDLGVSREAISWLQTARLFSGGLTAILIGRYLDRHGARLMLPAAATVVALAMITLRWTDDLWQMVVVFVIVGSAGLAGPGSLMTSVPVSKWFIRKRGRATALAASGLGIGGFIFAPLHQGLIDSFGWRGAWAISGLILMAVVIPMGLVFVRRTPEDHGLLPDGEQPHGGGVDAQEQSAADPATVQVHDREQSWTHREALRTASMWKMLVAYMLLALGMGGFIGHRFAFWSDRGFDESTIAWTLALDSLVFASSMLLAGFLVDRYPVRLVGAVAALIQILGVLATITLDNALGLYATAVAVGLGGGANGVVQIHIWPTYFGRAHIGSIRGIVVPTTLAGMGLGLPLVGRIYGVTGSYYPAFWMSIGLLAAAAFLLVTATPPKRRTAASASSTATQGAG